MEQQDSVHPGPFVDIQIAVTQKSDSSSFIPSEEDFLRWAEAALPNNKMGSELTIRVVEEEESQALNRTYRNSNKPTNVLSFPSTVPEELNIPLLGDLVICASVVNSESKEQGKTNVEHWAHMVIHGVLHLLGYDHTEEQDAIEMETLETKIITALGYPAPYGED